ncbi:DNA methyltransferase [Bacillus cytotoxicus]|uniref:DNA methyltransferase n=1 Tax=Bacillus cytotoxicus TaxID=580165 RepID=UPI003D7CDF69
MQNLLNEFIQVIKNDERLVVDGYVNKAKIEDLALNLDSDFLNILLNHEGLKKHFFQAVGNVLVFDKVKFQSFIANKSFLPDSYTSYKNKIGLLNIENQFISQSKNVSLVFPHKDCVLEGGQSEEEAKRDEIFWNELLAPDQIDQLLAPKVLTNFKRYDENGEHKVENISIKDNFLIKGNNLLALHTLKEIYAGKVKVIYIDPPYNTENDTFMYNDTFTHSTWLTFMKNRLEIAKKLLRPDGVLFINTDEIEHAYLKVLCDEIFDRENFVGDLIWKKRKGGGNDSTYLALDHDYILVYAKNKSKDVHKKKWRVPYTPEYLERYKEIDENNGRRYYWDTLSRDGLQNPIVVELDCPDGTKITINSQKSKETILEELETGLVRITETRNGWTVHHRVYEPEEGKVLRSILDNVGTNKTAKDEIKALFNDDKAFKHPKPEQLLQTLITLASEEGDLVMDFFVGSGTTAAVAHKLNRQYIAIEQLDYIENITAKRLQKVVEGEQGGISEAFNWSGGGSFIYCELMKVNQLWVDKIVEATQEGELLDFWHKMQEEAFLSYKINPKEINESISDFQELAFDEKKKFLIEVLDKNLLYLSYSEIQDEDFKVSEEDKILNEKFYSLKD